METSVRRQRLVAVAMVRDEQGRYLVQQRHSVQYLAAHERWEFPGGCIDFGESPEDAAVRETSEETGVRCAVVRMVPTVQSRVWERVDGVQSHAVVLCFECRYLGGTPTPGDPSVIQVAWKTVDEILTLDCLPGIPAFLEAASSQRLTG